MSVIEPEEFSDALEALGPTWPLAVAVSGGGDSMALLRLLKAHADVAQFREAFTVLTVDHGLRPQSAQEAQQVADWCSALEVPLVTLTWEGSKPASNIQAAARKARYDLLTSWCQAHGCHTLLTAHHLDDQAETFLLRLARGSGVDGLSAMTPVRSLSPSVRLMRPLLSFSKERLLATAQDFDQAYLEDPSNDNPDFDRVRFRQYSEELAALGLTSDRLAATSQRLGRAREALDIVSRQAFEECATVHGLGFIEIELPSYARLPEEIALRVLTESLNAIGGQDYRPRSERTERLHRNLVKGGAKISQTLHGCLIEGSSETVRIFRERRPPLPVLHLPDQGPAKGVFDGRFAFVVEAPQGLEIRMLGEAGLAAAKELKEVPDKAPRAALLALPALFREDTLVAAPHLGINQEKAQFLAILPFERLRGPKAP